MSDPAAPRIVVMGVSGVGKSTVGAALAARLGIPFLDADDLHTPEAVARMRSGEPLTDDDRMPWLARCGAVLAAAPEGAVLACSALARRYRVAILSAAPEAVFVALETDASRVVDRATHRPGHFMPASLVTSQYATYEPLAPDEPGVAVDAGDAVADVIAAALRALGR
ncbi:gluconokinase [Microbacterium sp. 18062]|uniref:gluconokinase n=1 Tax=Microbacterium sp. 18062 TaxID=2681410 RepID=UPI001F37DB7C|nr:gluconokinase [Microbacterium sp. 18062]